jgi:uncharacterized protein YraI
MLQLSYRALRRVTSVLALLLCVSFLVPSASLAQSGGGAGSTGAAITVAPLNMRSGPATTEPIVAIIPSDTTVTVTGASEAGFLPISWDGVNGWVSADYVTMDATTPPPAPAPEAPVISTLVASSDLNLRSAPDLAASVLAVIPGGASVGITGSAESGFLPVNFDGTFGWASAEYLQDSSASVPAPESTPVGSGLIWPVSGSEWSIIQGYNGGTHQNRSASAQYYYALDIARTDGATAGQAVYAPASGAILWLDPGSGGIAIDMGNGYTVAMFHVTFDGSLGSGQSVSQGQYLGTISGPGGAGYASTPHVDITLWQTANGGRAAAPFSGGNAISGMDLPDVGGGNQHGGTTFYP